MARHCVIIQADSSAPGAQEGQQRPVGARQAAHVPESQVAQLGVVGHESQQPDQAEGDRRDGHAGQQQARHARHAPAHRIGAQRGQQAAGEGRRRGDPEAAGRQHDGADRAQRAAGGDADQARLGQRIAEQRLHGGAGHGKPAPPPRRTARAAGGCRSAHCATAPDRARARPRAAPAARAAEWTRPAGAGGQHGDRQRQTDQRHRARRASAP